MTEIQVVLKETLNKRTVRKSLLNRPNWSYQFPQLKGMAVRHD